MIYVEIVIYLLVGCVVNAIMQAFYGKFEGEEAVCLFVVIMFWPIVLVGLLIYGICCFLYVGTNKLTDIIQSLISLHKQR